MSGRSLELQVSLGLTSAKQQLNDFMQVAQKGLKPDSSGYKDIVKLIDQAGKSVDQLTGKMQSAFKSSSGAKSFGREYERLLDVLNEIQSKFGSVSIGSLNISDDQLKSLTEAQERLADLKKEFNSINAGKIGLGLTDTSSEFEKIRSVAQSLKVDLSNITFADFGEKIKTALSKAEPEANKLQQQFDKLNTLVDSFTGANLAKVTTDLKNISGKGIGQKIGDSKEIDQINQKLQELSNNLELPGKKINTFTTKNGQNTEKFIEDETTKIISAYDKQVSEINAKQTEVQRAIDGINTAKANGNGTDKLGRKKGITETQINTLINSDEVQHALQLVNFDFKSDDYVQANVREKFRQIQQALSEGVTSLTKDKTHFEDLRTGFEEKIKDVFKGMGETTITSADEYIRKVNDILKAGNISLKDIGIKKEDIAGKGVEEAIQSITTALDSYIETQKKAASELKTTGGLDEATQKVKTLQEAQEALKSVQESTSTRKTNTSDELEKQVDLVNTLMQTLRQLTGMNVQLIKPQEVEQGSQAIQKLTNDLLKLENRKKTIGNIQMAIQRWMGFYQVLNLTKRAVNSMKQHITELDTVMTKIAVVTSMSQDDLWGQIGQYSEMARQYGVAIKGVYEVSQLYYQQGLQKGDVMTLTQETLKMARIAGIEYSTAADYMTTAIRGFKLEMSDAGHVTDVFSNLAANTASSTEELAVAISKTAASAASVGSSFEATSAMMATMIATTRESATNIGTALKSIISRYGEMKTNLTGTDQEGEEYSLNKVDKALQSIGISIHDAQGQFRDFDDVILELAESWDTIDKNTQRYIATVMAGNRQQSRFLALVSNVEEYKRALELANDSEGVGDIQTLKTLDSVDAKVERLKVTVQEFYTSSGIQDLYKGILDTITNVINASNKLPKMFDVIPAQAISIGANLVSVIKNVLLDIAASIKNQMDTIFGDGESRLATFATKIADYLHKGFKDGATQGQQELQNAVNNTNTNKTGMNIKNTAMRYGGMALSIAGSALQISGLNTYGSSTSREQDMIASNQLGAGVLGSIGGQALMGAAMSPTAPWLGALLGGLMGVVQNFGSILSAFNMANVDLARRIELSTKNLTEKRQAETEAKGEAKSLQNAVDKYQQLQEASYSSAEAMAEFIEYQNQLSESYPELVDNITLAGDKVIELASLEEQLANARQKSADATVEAIEAEIEDDENKQESYENLYNGINQFYNSSFEGAYGNAQWYADWFAGTAAGSQGTDVKGNSLHDIYAQGKYKEFLVKAYNAAQIPEKRLSTYGASTNFDAIYDHNEQLLVDYFNKQLSSVFAESNYDPLRERRNSFKQLLKKVNEELDVKFTEITGIKEIDSLDAIDELDNDSLVLAIENTLSWANDNLKKATSVIESTKDSLAVAKINAAITKYTAKEEHSKSKLTKYDSFVSSMIDKQYGRVDWSETKQVNGTSNADILQQNLEWWDKWLNKYSDDADWLIKEFSYDNINSTDDIGTIFREHHITNADIIAATQAEYVELVSQQVEGYTEAIDQYLGFDNTGISTSEIDKLKNLFTYTEGATEVDNKLTGALAKQLQGKLQVYKKLFDNGQTLDAVNYAESLISFYSAIGDLTLDTDKDKVAEIIKDIDFRDVESLTDIADKLKDAGYDKLADELNNAAQKLGVNVVAQAQSLSDALKDNIKGIEKVTEKIGKGMKYSDALEAAKEILSKAGTDAEGIALMETDSQKGLLAYDKTLGEYVLTNTAIDTWINALKNDQQDKIDQLERSNVQQSALYNSLLKQKMDLKQDQEETDIEYNERTADWAKDQVNKLKQSGVKLTENEEKRYAGDVQNLITEFNDAQKENNDLTWKTFIENKQKLLDQNNLLEMQILESATKNSILSTISSYDFNSIVSGQGGQFSKSNLITLLKSAGVKSTDIGFEIMYKNLLEGNFTTLEAMLAQVGGSISTKTLDDVHASIVSNYLKILDHLNDPDSNPVDTALQAQIDQIKTLHPEIGDDEGKLREYVENFIQDAAIFGWTSLSQVKDTQMDSLKKAQHDQNIGRSKEFLDAFKDGFTTDELTTLYKNWGISIFDNNHEIIKELQDYLEVDQETGQIKAVAGKSITEVLTALSTVLELGLDTTSQLYKDTLKSEVQQKITKLDSEDVGKQAAATLSTIASAKAGTRIDVTSLPEEMQQQLNANADGIAQIVSEFERDQWILSLNTYDIKNPEWRDAVKELQKNIQSKRNRNTTFKGMLSSTITNSEMESYLAALGKNVETYDIDASLRSRGYIYDQYAQTWKATQKTLNWANEELTKVITEGTASDETINELQAQVKQLEYELERDPVKDALTNLLSNYSNVSNDILAEFSAQFDKIDIDKYIIKDAQGNKKVNIGQLQAAIKKQYGEVSDAWMELFEQPLTELKDTYLSNITQATSFVTQGTSSHAELQSFIQGAKELGMEIPESAFQYDAILNAWTLDATLLTEYIETQAQELISLGVLTTSELESYVNTNVQQSLARSIDISSFLQAENKGVGSEAYKTLEKSLATYINSSDELLKSVQDQYIESILADAPADSRGYIESQMRSAGGPSSKVIADFYIGQIKQGGAQAVEIMKAIAKAQNQELSASDIEAAYRVQISELEDAFDQLSYGPGALISGQAKAIYDAIDKAGAYHTNIDDSTAVITTTLDNISLAYQEYYNRLVNSGEATLGAINEAKAKILETQNGNAVEQAAIDALGSASGMTYSAFAEIFTNAGLELTDTIINQLFEDNIIESMGGNKMRIKDFTRFAEAMGWDYDSEEYISAYKSYNDGLIELNRKVEKDITSEITTLKDAKPGDWLNVTTLSNNLSKQIVKHTATEIDEMVEGIPTGTDFETTALQDLNRALSIYGAHISDGILKLGENANLLGISKTIENAVAHSQTELKEGLIEIADSVAEILKSYVDAIAQGIEGGLNSVDANDLASKARDLGISKIDFNKTAEGLKLSEQSAIALYTALKKVDGLQATLVFDKLKESLEKTNENFASSSALTSYIVEIRKEINSADTQVSDARLQQYQAELSVAQEILAIRATQEDSSFNFMSNSIPAAQNNPLNYAKNWSQALQTIRDAFKTSSGKKGGKVGFIDYEDWYNIVTEMNRVAALGEPIKLGALTLDGSLEAASNAIQAGCDSLTAIDTGEIKVNLGSIGIGIKSGAEAMQDSVTSGIQAAAKSQVKMLDGLIAMLEIIVAMEQLGDITGEDTQIDLGDIFVFSDENDVTSEITGFTEKFDEARQKLLKYVTANKDLKERFENTSMNLGGTMHNMLEMLGQDANGNIIPKEALFDQLFGGKEFTPDQKRGIQESYQKMLNGFYQAAINGDYNLDDIAASVQKIVEEAGLDLSDFVYNITDENGKVVRTITFTGETAVEIDYTDKDARKAIDNYLGSKKYEKNQDAYASYIQDLINKYKTGKDGQTSIDTTEMINIRTQIGIASNEFVLQKDANGKYTGYYDGKKFEGTDQKTILNLMGEAAIYKDQGVDFTVDVDSTGAAKGIKGKTTISGIDIDVTLDNGQVVYHYGDYSGSKEVVMAAIAKEGRQTETGEYQLPGEDYTISVKKAIGLDLTYSYYNDGTPHYVYGDHDFGDNYDQMYNYMQLSNKFDPTGTKGTWETYYENNEKKEKRVIKVNKDVTVQMVFTATGIQTLISFNDGTGAQGGWSEDQIAAYIEAAGMEAFEDLGQTIESDGTRKRTVKFRSSGYKIEAEFNISKGTTTYTYTDGDTVYSADRLSDLQAYLDAIKGKDLEVNSSKEYIIKKTVKGKVEVEIKIVDGKITNIDEVKNAGMTDEEIAALEAKLAGQPQTLENEVQAKASSIKILTEGAEIGLDVAALEVKEPIDIKVPAKSITITDANGAAINLGNIEGTGTQSNSNTASTSTDSSGGNFFTNTFDAINNSISTVIGLSKDIVTTGIENFVELSKNVDSSGIKDIAQTADSLNGDKISAIQSALNNLSVDMEGKNVEATANIVVQITHGSSSVAVAKGTIGDLSKGNFALAGGTPTLMGELGPELVVSQGRYFIVGQNGAEFVSLDKDAIVFNHKQTERLFANGAIGSRGKPFTNETNAISFAKGTGSALSDGTNSWANIWNQFTKLFGGKNNGNIPPEEGSEAEWNKEWTYTYNIQTSDGGVSGHLWGTPIAEIETPHVSAAKGNVPITGPANASASAALAALKQLRAQWASLASLSAKDLAGKGGGGGGGGGDSKAFIKELERWYNLLQEIAQLEKEINYQETLRSKIQSDFVKNGEAYYESQKKSMKDLEKEMLNHQNLAIQQENYFEQRRAELNSDSNPFSSLYTFDENGQLKYQNGKFEELSEMVGSDKYNNPNMTPEEQYNYIVNTLGISADYMKYDNSGNEIEFENGKPKDEAAYTSAIQAFWDKIESDQDEMQNLHDSIEEHKEAVLEAQQQQNEILREMQDNELELEENIFDALVDMRERMIEEMEDEKNAYEDSANKMIDGLTDALNKEKEMYERQENQTETDRMRRRLAILLNSGGSSSEILDLQEQLRQRDKDAYFEATQQEIDNIKEASDAEIERLDAQIELEKEMLEYQKAHGLLWEEVRNIMTENDPQGIADYIVRNNSEYWSQSPTKTTKQMDDLLFSSTQWKKYQTDTDTYFKQIVDSITKNDGEKQWENYVQILKEIYGEDYEPDEEVKKAFLAKYGSTSDPNQAAAAGTEAVEAQEVEKEAADKKDDSGYAKNVGGQWMQGEGGRWWYKHSDGGYTKDNWEMINDKWYYFDKEGWMKTGWLEKDDQWYYFDDTSGEMLANTTKALNYNGKVQNHTFNENGVWIGASDINNTSKKKTTWEFDGTKWVEYALNKDGEKGDATGGYSYSDPTVKKKKAAGGYVNHGLYELGELGTETVLTASQTKVLRDNILSNRPNSLINLLKSYNEAYQGLSSSTYDQISNQNQESIVIEHAEVNMNVEEIANDYDAQRAGEQALQEMLRIARKTGATSIRR